MIGYVTLGTNDLPRAARFYDALAGELGVPRFMQGDTHIAWGVAGGGAGVAVTKPFDGNPASVGNGTMIALQAKDPVQVDRLHAIALEHGGRDEGAPGRARRRILRRLFPRSRRQQAQRFLHAGAGR